jgi:molybdenum cofactor biosynthesis enzyme
MVDVSSKKETERIAIACGDVVMRRETLDLIQQGITKKEMFLLWLSWLA